MAQMICEELCAGYDGRVTVGGLSFSVEKGSYVCVIGENGAGKSTLMKTLLGLNKPLGGSVKFEGLESGDIGYLPQQTAVQKDFPASVWEIVLSGCQGSAGLRPFYTADEKRRAESCLERMGIHGLSQRCYRELSGGQQQRVLLARALCAARKMLFLDEPVTGLDPAAAAEMYRIVRELNKDGVTVIMVSHDVEAALEDASHVLRIGETVFYGTRQEYLEGGRA